MLVWERQLTVIALVTVVVAWTVGLVLYDSNVGPFLSQALPAASRFEECGSGIFAGFETDGHEQRIIGYVAVGKANGYGGPMRVAVGVNTRGSVDGLAVVGHHETPAYFQRVLHTGLHRSLLTKEYSDRFSLGDDVDAVAGATKTAAALTESVRSAARNVAGDMLSLPLPPQAIAPIGFGIPELTLLSLFLVGFASHTARIKRKKIVRWVCLLTGLVVLGFMFNAQLTLVNINSLLIGYWPPWRSHVYWYLLIVAVLILPVITSRNPYCSSICPFGAAQECLAVLGQAKPRVPARYRRYLRWLPRILAWASILLALTYRSPALASYEVYGALFDVVGSHLQFGLLAAVLVASLFLTRPWCDYLCPVRGVTDYVKLGGKWGRRALGRIIQKWRGIEF